MKGQMDEKSASNANAYADKMIIDSKTPYGGYIPSELRMEEANPHNNFHANPYLQMP